MRHAARLFIDRRIDRRTFVARVGQMGLAPMAATALARSLSAGSPADPVGQPGRELSGATGGEIMAEFLIDWNVPYVFGLGGSEEIGFLDALVDRVALQYVQALHESSVTAMADGYARASGRTAFVNLHSVAGTAYALGQMVNAFKDRVPLVITAGEQDTRVRGHNAFLEGLNLAQLPRDYTRWHWDVLSVESIPEVLRRAFLLARVPPAGPTFVTFSKDLWERRVPRTEILPPLPMQPEEQLYPDPDAVRRAVDLLVEAQLPVIVAGRELQPYGGVGEVREIAERLGAPVCSDLFATHVPITFPTGHAHYAGYFAESPEFPKDFDCFWSAGGAMFGIMAPPPAPLVPRSARIIHTTVDGAEIGRNYPVDVPMLANIKPAARAMLEELDRRTLPATVVDDRRRHVLEQTARRRRRLEEQAARAWDSRPVSNERLSIELDRRLDPSAIIVSELISEEQLANSYLTFNESEAGRRQFITSGGCLGWGVANAIGARIGRPDRQVVALVGDGSFQFGVQALWTAARYEVPVLVVIWNNGGYQANRRYLYEYGGRAAATGRFIGVSLASPAIDHVAICQAYGVEGERVADPDRLGAALDRALRAVADGRPYVVDVEVRRRFGGADSTWYDFFSIARGLPRQS